jgi:hypothetical protein
MDQDEKVSTQRRTPMDTACTIEVWIDGTPFRVELNKTKTATEIYDALPLHGDGSRWGEEIYFDVGKDFPAENPTEEVEVGDVAYWFPGKALCLFFGRTPASTSDRPRAASPVTVVGRLTGNIEMLKEIADLQNIEVKKAER